MLKSEKKEFMTSLEELLFKSGKNPNGSPTAGPRGVNGEVAKKAKRASVPEPKKLNVSSAFADKLANDFSKRKLGGEQQKRVQSVNQNANQNPKPKKGKTPPQLPKRTAQQQLSKEVVDDSPRLSKTAWELFKAQYGEGSANMKQRSAGSRVAERTNVRKLRKGSGTSELQEVKKPEPVRSPPQKTLPGGSKTKELVTEEEEEEVKEEEEKKEVVKEEKVVEVKKEDVVEVKKEEVLEAKKEDVEEEEKEEEVKKEAVKSVNESEIKKEEEELLKERPKNVSAERVEPVVEKTTKTQTSAKKQMPSILELNESGIQEMDEAIFHEINELRKNPASYIPILVEELKLKRYDEAAIEEAIAALEMKEPTVEMEWAPGLSQAAALHVELAGKAGDFGHVLGPENSTPLERVHKYDTDIGAMSAFLRFGGKLSPQDVVIGFLIDEGDPRRRHREGLFAFWEKFGCFTGPHEKAKYMTAIHVAQTKAATKQLMDIAVSAWEETIEEPEGYSAQTPNGWVRKDQAVSQNQGVITVTNTYFYKDEEPQIIEATIKHYKD